MAIAFSRISYHSRSQGHSAVAGAAYRAGKKLHDERTGETHDYTNRSDVLYSQVMLPEGADPAFADRNFLWNAVELAERRKDSQVAKDIIIALPRDVDLSHQIELARNFADYHFVRHGLVADIAIHDHDDGNPHAHLYVTTRRLLGDHFDKFKARDLEPDVVRGRVVDPQYWGEQWRNFQNQYFTKHDLKLVVDANHILTQRHEGRITGEAHYLKQENELRRQASIEIAINDPASVLNLLGSKHAVFSDRDIALLIHRNTETAAEFEKAMAGIKAHRDLVLLGSGDDGRDRYTTRANYQREATLADHAAALSVSNQHRVDQRIVEQTVQSVQLNAEQASALSHIADSGDICAVVGRAGTGKSYMMKAARQMWERSGFKVRGMAVSGIASKGLEMSSGIPSSTIHSIKMQIAFGSLKIDKNDIFVMDEAGMTDLYDLAVVVDAMKAAGAKLVLVGDADQLQPVGPGAPFRAVVEQVGFAELNQIQRQESLDDCAASVLLSRGEVGAALDHYTAKQQIHLIDADAQSTEEDDDGDEEGGGHMGGMGAAIKRLVKDWGKDLSEDSLQEKLILAHRNIDVGALNLQARQMMRERGLLNKNEHTINGIEGKQLQLSMGDRILFLRNNKQLGIFNGEFATIKRIEGEHITVMLGTKDKPRSMRFSTKDYQDFDYGYAATVHKAQGVSVDHTYVYVGGRAWDRFLAYVSMTRHRKSLNVYADQSQFEDLDKLKQTLSRSTLKDSVLDWPLSYAIRRGFNPDGMIGRFIDKVVGTKQAIQDKWLFVVNYEAYLKKKVHQASRTEKQSHRQLAKQVALFVDLQRGLEQQWQMIKQDTAHGEQPSTHHDYATYYQQSLLKGQLAQSLLQHTGKQKAAIETALELNRMRQSTLENAAHDHVRYQTIKAYINHLEQGKITHCHKLANQIQAEFKQHYRHIAYFAALSEQHSLSTNELSRKVRQHALAYQRLKVLKTLTSKERQDFKTVDQYMRADQHLRDSLSRVYTLGGFDKLSTLDVQMLKAQKEKADQLASRLIQEPERFKAALHFYDIDEDRLIDGHERAQARQTVKQLKEAATPTLRDALCTELLADKRYYPLIAEQGLDWKALRAGQANHEHRETLKRLSNKERHFYRLVYDYQHARQDVGIAWSKLYQDKEQKQFISDARWQFAMKLTQQRNRLAHQIILHKQQCMPFVDALSKSTKLRLSDIEQQSAHHIETLIKIKVAQVETNKILRAGRKQEIRQQHQAGLQKPHTSNYLDYQTINDGLIKMGERFYTMVLGDKSQRSGNSLRFGHKGSLTVTTKGSNTGSWHSFETGEGGGPVQLMMNANHGWGLPFKEALAEGARIAGISAEHSLPPTHAPNAQQSKPPSPADDKAALKDRADRIERARYYYRGAEPVNDTLGERYLKEHRKLGGDLSAFRYHPKIRDDYYDKEGKHHVSFHPAIIVAAKNERNEITAVQTILLDPQTANKVDKSQVGAVKRTRGDLKGSAVQIHQGTSNKVIIAEGPETGASLIQAEPDANIYITLGNIKNAAELGWLAEKHQTKEFHFAADNDGPHANNMKALQDVVQILEKKHNIKSVISMPELPGYEKCDFNDVLMQKGSKSIKEQLSKTKSIEAFFQPPKLDKDKPSKAQHKTNQSQSDQALMDAVKDQNIDWTILKRFNNERCELLLKARELALRKSPDEDTSRITGVITNLMRKLSDTTKIIAQIEEMSPKLSHLIKAQQKKPTKYITINWQSPEYKAEWEKLRTVDNDQIKSMVRWFDKSLSKKEGVKKYNDIITQLVIKIANRPRRFEHLRQHAPKMVSNIQQLMKMRSKSKGMTKDWD